MPEPAMLLNKKEFKPYQSFDDRIVCRKVQTKEDFQSWVSIVNTALHGWDMIDADNYYTWIEVSPQKSSICCVFKSYNRPLFKWS